MTFFSLNLLWLPRYEAIPWRALPWSVSFNTSRRGCLFGLSCDYCLPILVGSGSEPPTPHWVLPRYTSMSLRLGTYPVGSHRLLRVNASAVHT